MMFSVKKIKEPERQTEEKLRRPSGLYRTDLWKLGLAAVPMMPASATHWLGRSLAAIYCAFNFGRRKVVAENLLPLVNGNEIKAELLTRELFREFSIKISDLWRYESGLSIRDLIEGWTGWEHFECAKSQGRGILLVTPHLGNWEFGAPLLAEQGVPLTVITQVEPDPRLTALRQSSRKRWGIETIVIGSDPFAFVEIIRRLECGAVIALLIDRPPAASAVTIQFSGRPFAASIAVAELARASGCSVLHVYLLRNPNGYTAHILPEVPYDRQKLGKREMRRQFTEELMQVFEPVIKRHITQWYHFVPIWPAIMKDSGKQ